MSHTSRVRSHIQLMKKEVNKEKDLKNNVLSGINPPPSFSPWERRPDNSKILFFWLPLMRFFWNNTRITTLLKPLLSVPSLNMREFFCPETISIWFLNMHFNGFPTVWGRGVGFVFLQAIFMYLLLEYLKLHTHFFRFYWRGGGAFLWGLYCI